MFFQMGLKDLTPGRSFHHWKEMFVHLAISPEENPEGPQGFFNFAFARFFLVPNGYFSLVQDQMIDAPLCISTADRFCSSLSGRVHDFLLMQDKVKGFAYPYALVLSAQ